MSSLASPPALARLRRAVADLDESRSCGLVPSDEHLLPLGLAEIDTVLAGGLALGAVHDLAPLAPGGPAQLGTVTGFALALAALTATRGGAPFFSLSPQSGERVGVRGCSPSPQNRGKPPSPDLTSFGRPLPARRGEVTGEVLWIQTEFAGLEAGLPYGPGLDLLGLPMSRLLVLRVPHPRDALWAFEEALKCRALAAVLAELPEAGAAADLTATRRLSLAARSGGGLGLLLRHRPSPAATAAMTRWEIAAAPSIPDRFGGLGHTAFELSLIRNRRGRAGRWIVQWSHHERSFIPQALSLGVAAAAGHGSSDPQPLARAG